jgi:hypothetical protein
MCMRTQQSCAKLLKKKGTATVSTCKVADSVLPKRAERYVIVDHIIRLLCKAHLMLRCFVLHLLGAAWPLFSCQFLCTGCGINLIFQCLEQIKMRIRYDWHLNQHMNPCMQVKTFDCVCPRY